MAQRNLSKRERQVLDLFLTGLPHLAIAQSLNISSRTVNNHIGAIFNTTGCRSRAELESWLSKTLCKAEAQPDGRSRQC